VAELLLEVEKLSVGFGGHAVIHDVNLAVHDGECLALVGESGSGKSLTAYSILRAVPPPGRILGGEIRFRGRDLRRLGEPAMRAIRGADIALIPQEPSSALTPVLTVGHQIAEILVAHGKADWRTARVRAVELLDAVKLDDPAARVSDYPHQLSGGQLQRILIAMALSCAPSLLIADEPTTALDVRVQADILDLLRDARDRHRLSLLLITHDLGVVAAMADRVAVMRGGHIVEEGTVRDVLRAPQHQYTQALLASARSPGGSRVRPQ
jgi:ABC-type dipeptide/oligopeptide/nickel transport system ATPase component